MKANNDSFHLRTHTYIYSRIKYSNLQYYEEAERKDLSCRTICVAEQRNYPLKCLKKGCYITRFMFFVLDATIFLSVAKIRLPPF